MAFISNKERSTLIKGINKNYILRKLIIVIEIISLLTLMIFCFRDFYKLSVCKTIEDFNNYVNKYAWLNQDKKLTLKGWLMLGWIMFTAITGIISLILVMDIKSPKKVFDNVSYLQSSAVSGKKITKKNRTTVSYRDRTSSEKK